MCYQARWAPEAIVPKQSFLPAAHSRLVARRPRGQEKDGHHAQALPVGAWGAGRHCTPGMAPFGEAHSSENKGLWGPPGNSQRPDSLLPQATLPASLPGPTFTWETIKEWPRSRPSPKQKNPVRGSIPSHTARQWLGLEEALGTVTSLTYYVLLHETELNHLKTI